MKTVQTKIECDTCKADISPKSSGYAATYILHVSAQNIELPSKNGFVYGMMIYPPINNDLYFCGIQCMKQYGDKQEQK